MKYDVWSASAKIGQRIFLDRDIEDRWRSWKWFDVV